jgi:hypothetical protein
MRGINALSWRSVPHFTFLDKKSLNITSGASKVLVTNVCIWYDGSWHKEPRLLGVLRYAILTTPGGGSDENTISDRVDILVRCRGVRAFMQEFGFQKS